MTTGESPGPSRRRPDVLALALAGLVALLLVTAVVTVPIAVDRWQDLTTPTLDSVRVYEGLPADHVEDDQSVEYGTVPPPGGPHADVWLACGVYDEPVRDENAVHALEHGTVWITYDPAELSAEDVATLAGRLPDEGILSPYPGQGVPVVVTVWGRQLDLRTVDDARLALFIDSYGDGHTSPEPMASCEGGEQITDDGVAGTNV